MLKSECLVLFVKLFNILYGTKIDCKLSNSVLFDDKLLNWNRINAVICFNYLQQRFYLVEPTMRTLAKGKSKKAIFKLLRVLINASQDNYGDADPETVKEIADVIEADGGVGKFELKGNILMTDGAAQKRSDKYAFLGMEGLTDQDSQ